MPSIPEGELVAVVPPELNVKPEGKVTTILPSAGIALIVVKATVTLPAVPATRLAGVTLVEVGTPAVIVTAATAASSSILTSEALVDLI